MDIREFNIYNGDCKVIVEITEEKKNAVIDSILKWCEQYNCNCGETLHQSDDCLIEAPSCLSDIIDNILEFRTECK